MTKLINSLIAHIPNPILEKTDRIIRSYYASKKYIVIPNCKECCIYYEGTKFGVSSQIGTIAGVKKEYNFSDILKTDLVLDIGADIGAFTLLAAKMAKGVCAVEPLYDDYLKENIRLNDLENVYVFNLGIDAEAKQRIICFGERKKKVCCTPLSHILDLIGGCDFMKIDCEGCEWSVTINDLKRIRRRIEGELHLFNGENEEVFWSRLKAAGFDVTTEHRSRTTRLFHAYRRKA